MKIAGVICALVLASFATLAAQVVPIKLSFEVFKNETLIAQPIATVVAGATGSLTIDGIGKFDFTPTVRDAEHIAVEFDVEAAGKNFKPRLVIGSESGSLSWTANAQDAFELRVKWVK